MPSTRGDITVTSWWRQYVQATPEREGDYSQYLKDLQATGDLDAIWKERDEWTAEDIKKRGGKGQSTFWGDAQAAGMSPEEFWNSLSEEAKKSYAEEAAAYGDDNFKQTYAGSMDPGWSPGIGGDFWSGGGTTPPSGGYPPPGGGGGGYTPPPGSTPRPGGGWNLPNGGYIDNGGNYHGPGSGGGGGGTYPGGQPPDFGNGTPWPYPPQDPNDPRNPPEGYGPPIFPGTPGLPGTPGQPGTPGTPGQPGVIDPNNPPTGGTGGQGNPSNLLPPGVQQLLDDWKRAQEEAKAVNEQRYAEILQGYRDRGMSYEDAQAAAKAELDGNLDQIDQGYNDLLGNYLSAQELSALKLDSRYSDLNSRYASRETEMRSALDRPYSSLDAIGQGARQDIQARSTAERGRAEQDLVNRGLGNTTVRESVLRGISEDENKAYIQLADQLAQLRIGVDQNYANQLGNLTQQPLNSLENQIGQFNQNQQNTNLNAANLGQAGLNQQMSAAQLMNMLNQQGIAGNDAITQQMLQFMENRSDTYPDFAQMMQLLFLMGQGNTGYGAVGPDGQVPGLPGYGGTPSQPGGGGTGLIPGTPPTTPTRPGLEPQGPTFLPSTSAQQAGSTSPMGSLSYQPPSGPPEVTDYQQRLLQSETGSPYPVPQANYSSPSENATTQDWAAYQNYANSMPTNYSTGEYEVQSGSGTLGSGLTNAVPGQSPMPNGLYDLWSPNKASPNPWGVYDPNTMSYGQNYFGTPEMYTQVAPGGGAGYGGALPREPYQREDPVGTYAQTRTPNTYQPPTPEETYANYQASLGPAAYGLSYDQFMNQPQQRFLPTNPYQKVMY